MFWDNCQRGMDVISICMNGEEIFKILDGTGGVQGYW